MSCSLLAKKNLGLSQCNELPGMPKGMLVTPDDFAIPAATIASGDAAILAYINAAAIGAYANRIYLFPFFDSIEPIFKDAVYEDTPLSFLDVDAGAYRWRFGISQNLCLHKAMYTHYRKSGRVFLIDRNNKFIGTELTNGDFAGLSIQLLNLEKFQFNDGSVSTKSPILLALRDNRELDQSGYMLSGDFVNEIYRIVDVELTIVGAPSATTIVVDVKAVCDDTPLSGLVATDFFITDTDDGANHAITSVVESSTIPGRYTVTGVAFEDSTINIDPPATLSVKAYESSGAATVNVP
jgi:hypothetical protein